VFAAVTAGVGEELWVTDGTTAGTSLLKNVGPDGAYSIVNGITGPLTALGDGRALFVGDDGTHGLELWVTDGTDGGTTLVEDLAAGATDSAIYEVTAIGGGKALFRLADAASGLELWITDGTAAGTSLLKEIEAGSVGSNPTGFTAVAGGRTIFAADDGVSGVELWVTDGTTFGTSLLVDIQPGIDPSIYGSFLPIGGGRAIFGAYHATHGFELWVTDGTAANTSLVKDINPGTGDSFLGGLVALNDGRALFVADDGTSGPEIWITDGTSAGTTLVKDIYPGSSPYTGLSSDNFGAFGPGQVLFAADPDGTSGSELWITDGSSAGTSLLLDINTGTRSSFPYQFANLADGRVVFGAYDSTGVPALWVTDGTAAGTSQLAQNVLGSLTDTGLSGTGLLFAGSDGELWVTDGTVGGTHLVRDINPTPDAGSYVSGFTVISGGRVLFNANDGTSGNELWVTNGTTAGTSLLKDIGQAGYSSYTAIVATLGDGRVLLTANDGVNGVEVWVTNGTTAGTSLLKDIAPGSAHSFPEGFVTMADGRVLFRANDGTNGAELWVTDGTTAGTTLLKDIGAGIDSSNPVGLTRMNDGRVMFSATDGTTGTELWISDGTTDGTSLVKDIRTGTGSASPNRFALLDDGRVALTATTAAAGRELWVSDGTEAGTSLVRDIRAGSNSSRINEFFRLGDGRLVFSAIEAATGDELWVTDGTTAGTSLLRDIQVGTNGSSIRDFFALEDGRVLFVADDGVTGNADDVYSVPYGRDAGGELWVTDGTAEGTMLLADIRPGAAGSAIYGFTAAPGGRVLFQANDGTTGFELWTTDGTTAGTHLVTDLDDRTNSSNPTGFTDIILPQTPVIAGTVAAQAISGGNAISPFASVVIEDDDAIDLGETETATVVMSALHGFFGSVGTGAVSPDGLTYTVSGTPAAVQAALRALTFTPILAGIGTGFTLSVSDGTRTATDTITSVTDLSPPEITGLVASQSVQGLAAFSPFSTVVLTDPDAVTFGQTETASVTMSAAVGTFSNLGAGTLSPNGLTYTVSGAAADVQAALRALVYTPSVLTEVTFDLAVNDTDVTVHAAVTARALAEPTITGTVAVQAVTGANPINPFVGVLIADQDSTALGQVETATVVMSAAQGTLSNLGGGALSPDGLTYTVSGTPAVVQAALRGLVFTPTVFDVTTQFTLSVSDGLATATDTATTVVNSLTDPVISGITGPRNVSGATPVTPFDSVVVTDPDANSLGQTETATVVLSAANGTLSNLGTGAVSPDGLTYTVTGSPSAVQAALRALTFTSGTGLATTQFSLSVSDGITVTSNTDTTVTDIACYLLGTMILTPTGERPVETLAIGDLVSTHTGQSRPIRWIGRRGYAGRFVAGQTRVLPILIRQDALQDGVPHRDLMVSPQHAMYLDGVLIPASALVNGRSIIQVPAMDQVDYFHIELDTHDVIIAEGAPSETFVDDGSRAIFHNAHEYGQLYPGRREARPLYCAPRVEDGHALDLVLRRLEQRARSREDWETARLSGQMRGAIDVANHDRLSGWVRCDDQPETAVPLSILVDGEVVAHVVADQYRRDLELAGLGLGRHAFEVPLSLSPASSHDIRVVRRGDETDIPGSPLCLAPRPAAEIQLRGHLDALTRTRVTGWIRDDRRPTRPVAVLVVVDGEPVGHVRADQPRVDLLGLGEGEGRFGFSMDLCLSETGAHVVRLVHQGKDVLGSPHIVPAIEAVGRERGLRGHLDSVTRQRVAGWVLDEANPGQAVPLLVTANGAPIARILANRARPDLLGGGMETFRHGFDHLLAEPLSVLSRHEIRIFRESDGASFADPAVLEPPTSLDAEAEAGIAALLTAEVDDTDLDRRIRFLMTQTDTLLRERADRQGQRWQRETWRPSRQAWSRPLSVPPAMAVALREEGPRRRPSRALVIDDGLPDLSRDAGSHAILGHIASLRRLGFETTFVPALELDAADGKAAHRLAGQGISVAGAPFHHTVEDVLRQQAGLFDVIYLHRLSNASKYAALARQYCPDARLIYSVADLHHLRMHRQAAVLHEPALAQRAEAVRLAELMAVMAADQVITHSTHEASVLRAAGFGEKVNVVPWPVVVRPSAPRFQERHGIAFIGGYNHAPNLDAGICSTRSEDGLA